MSAYVRFETVRALRNPRFLLLVAVVPLVLYVIGVQRGNGPAGTVSGLPAGVWFLASAGALGAMTSALTVSGARLASERSSGWSRQLRVTPLSQTAWLGGRILSGLLVVIPIVAALAIVAATYGQVDLNARSWAQLALTLVVGAVPIALLGLLLGLLLRGEAAGAAQSLAFLLLAFLGGAFASSPPTGLTKLISEVAPTYYLVGAARAAVRGVRPATSDIIGLCLCTVLLAIAVVWIRRRAD
jgi:ABC-2 type transport system permease protein